MVTELQLKAKSTRKSGSGKELKLRISQRGRSQIYPIPLQKNLFSITWADHPTKSEVEEKGPYGK